MAASFSANITIPRAGLPIPSPRIFLTKPSVYMQVQAVAVCIKIDAQKRATGFDLRYNANLSPSDSDWRDCSNVLSQRDFGTLMREGWEK
jgi:hypothetical protein